MYSLFKRVAPSAKTASSKEGQPDKKKKLAYPNLFKREAVPSAKTSSSKEGQLDKKQKLDPVQLNNAPTPHLFAYSNSAYISCIENTDNNAIKEQSTTEQHPKKPSKPTPSVSQPIPSKREKPFSTAGINTIGHPHFNFNRPSGKAIPFMHDTGRDEALFEAYAAAGLTI